MLVERGIAAGPSADCRRSHRGQLVHEGSMGWPAAQRAVTGGVWLAGAAELFSGVPQARQAPADGGFNAWQLEHSITVSPPGPRRGLMSDHRRLKTPSMGNRGSCPPLNILSGAGSLFAGGTETVTTGLSLGGTHVPY